MRARLITIAVGTVLMVVGLALAAGEQVAAADQIRYEATGKRDPFVPLIGQDKTAATSLDDVTSIEDIKLEGIAVGARGRRVAIINGQMLKDDDKVGLIEMRKITSTTVTLLFDGKEYALNLSQEKRKE